MRFITLVCNGDVITLRSRRVHPTHIRDRCVQSACKTKHCAIRACAPIRSGNASLEAGAAPELGCPQVQLDSFDWPIEWDDCSATTVGEDNQRIVGRHLDCLAEPKSRGFTHSFEI